MRKLCLILFALALIVSVAVTGYAQKVDLVLSDVDAKPGDVVYLTAKLETKLTADALGLSYTYDEKILEPMPAASWSWEVKGSIKNFDIKKDRAVWGASEPTQLQGDICVMSFRVLEGVRLTRTKVTCELIVKNQGQEVGIYTAEGIIGQPCEHEYGPWNGQDKLWHTAECALCGKTLTQSHMWDDGVKTAVDGKQLMRFTCTVCHRNKDAELSGTESQETKPTGPADPVQTTPTTPVTSPTEHRHEDDIRDTIPTTAPDDHTGHDHQGGINDMQTTPANDEESNTEPTEESAHDHTHEDVVVSRNNPVTASVVVAAVIVLLGAAVYFVKKK